MGIGDSSDAGSACADAEVLARMRRDWDERAKENAFHYIASGRENWDDAAFYESGRASVREIVLADGPGLLRGRDPASLKVLEIGCGAGRMTLALAEAFKEVHAVDVSGEMVHRAQAQLAGVLNAHVYQNDGAGLAGIDATEFDLALSFIVFQHIPSASVVGRYLRDVAVRLKPDAIFKLQVQGSPLAILGRGDTWEGCYIPGSKWLRWARQYGFRMARFEGVGTQYQWLWLERATPPPAELSEIELAYLDAERDAFADSLHSFACRTKEAAEELARQEERNGELSETLSDLEQELGCVYGSLAYRLGRPLRLVPARRDRGAAAG
jgi:SAM-dependent methyltransferase